MNPSNLTELFHTVLDGEASDEEARELEQRMAGDSGIRAAFEDLKRLFDGLARVPMAFPPEGLVAAVMANIPQNGPPRRDDDQLLPVQGVIGSDTNRIGGAASRKMSGVRRVSQPWVFSRGAKMNEQNSGFSRNRKMWIAGAIGAAVAVIAVSSLFEPSTGGKDTAGTIVPAQRYQASQNMGQDVQGGGTGGVAGSQATANQPGTAAAGISGLNSDNGGGRGVDNGGGRGVDNGGGRGVDNGGGRGVDNGGGRGVDNGGGRGVDNGGGRGVDNGGGRAVDNGGGRAVDNGGGRAVDNGGGRAVDNGGGRAVDNGGGRAVDNGGGRAVDNGGGRAVDNGGGRAVDNGGGRAVDNGGGRAVDNGGGRGVDN